MESHWRLSCLFSSYLLAMLAFMLLLFFNAIFRSTDLFVVPSDSFFVWPQIVNVLVFLIAKILLYSFDFSSHFSLLYVIKVYIIQKWQLNWRHSLLKAKWKVR